MGTELVVDRRAKHHDNRGEAPVIQGLSRIFPERNAVDHAFAVAIGDVVQRIQLEEEQQNLICDFMDYINDGAPNPAPYCALYGELLIPVREDTLMTAPLSFFANIPI